MSAWLVAALSFAGIGLFLNAYAFYQMRGLIDLGTVDAPEPPEWPSVSLVIPACNEGETIAASLATVVALDYPSLQVIVVNDRSTDDTGAIVDAIAAEHPQVEVITSRSCPRGGSASSTRCTSAASPRPETSSSSPTPTCTSAQTPCAERWPGRSGTPWTWSPSSR